MATKTERGVHAAGNALTFEVTTAAGQKIDTDEIVNRINAEHMGKKFNIT